MYNEKQNIVTSPIRTIFLFPHVSRRLELYLELTELVIKTIRSVAEDNK